MYILDQQTQIKLKKHFLLVEVKNNGWEKIYFDPLTLQRWIEYHPFSEYHGGGPSYLRHENIPEDIFIFVDTCLNSENSDDAIGAGTDLSSRTELWTAILDFLEENQNKYNHYQVQKFIESLDILSVINRDPTLGKTPSERKNDFNKWASLSERAKTLLGNR